METKLDQATTEEFLAVYRDSFTPLENKAAARQSLTDDEFREEMLEESVLKFVAWDEDGGVAALAFVATDLSIVPWISLAYFQEKFPEHYARGAIYYYGALLVRSDRRGGTTSYELLKELCRFTATNKAIAAFDCCRYNEDAIKLPELVATVAREVCVVDTQQIDHQAYYAYITSALQEGYSTAPIPSIRDVIDLRAAEAEEDRVDIDLVALEEQAGRSPLSASEQEISQ